MMKAEESSSASVDGGGLYVHIAYCRKKCIYCDFFSAGERIADWPRYVDALGSEFRNRIDELAWPLRTVYFGGGTPSLIPEGEFLRLCSFLRPYSEDIIEFTLEVNPDDVDERKIELWKKGGVNRISMGIQSFNDSLLKSIGRRHDARRALEAYRLARHAFDNISIDLMFGLPGQNLEDWKRDLSIALELNPEHISAYTLMYEDGTPLTALRNSGRIHEASEDLTEKMFITLIEFLSDAGYDHYEISNFARPGFRSRHNSSYWLQKPYLGLGPAAHSYDGRRIRKANSKDLRGYLQYWAPRDNGIAIVSNQISDTERLTDEELREEYLMTRLRMREGIPISDFRTRFGDDAVDLLMSKSAPLVDRSLISNNGSFISLTEKAILLSDSVILDLASLF